MYVLNNIDNFCLYYFIKILSSSLTDVLVFGWNWLMNLPRRRPFVIPWRHRSRFRLRGFQPLSRRGSLAPLLVRNLSCVLFGLFIGHYQGLFSCVKSDYLKFILTSRVFAKGPEDRGSIPGRVIPKTQKMVLDTAFLNTQHDKVRIKIKWSNPEKGVALSPLPRSNSY